MIDSHLWRLIQAYAPRLGLDPHAVAAVSMVEGGGRFGAVGDSGSSFGPFQLHVGGALPRGKGAAWANSAAGVLYAMQRMAASGARGLHGSDAVRAIVYHFERPADPAGEVRRALDHYASLRPGQAGPPMSANRSSNTVFAALAAASRPVQLTFQSLQGRSPADIIMGAGQQQPSYTQPVQPIQLPTAESVRSNLDALRNQLLGVGS